jgi:ATP-binding cassette subfamily B protein
MHTTNRTRIGIDRKRLEQMLTPRAQIAQLRHVPAALGLVWTAASRWTVATVLLLVVQGLLPVCTVYLTRSLVNALVAVTGKGVSPATVEPVILAAGLMGVVLVATEVLSSLAGYVRMALAEQVQDHMNGLVHAKSIALDLRFYESATYYD